LKGNVETPRYTKGSRLRMNVVSREVLMESRGEWRDVIIRMTHASGKSNES
jgi:hypothetical protein